MGQISIGQWPPSHELDHPLGAAVEGKAGLVLCST